MNTISRRNSTNGYPLRTIASVLVFSFFATCIDAQVLVIDSPATAVNSAGFSSQLAKTVAQYTLQLEQRTTQIRAYASQLMQYEKQIQQYQQLLMTVAGLGTNISFSSNKLKRIDDYAEIIEQNCPAPAGGSIVSSVVTSIASSISASQSITESQNQICAQITMVQIDQYNKTIEISNLLDGYGGTLQKLNKLANQINSLGSASGATTQAETYSATVSFAMKHWQTQMEGGDALIKALEHEQTILARVAMRGKSTVLGNVVQAATLEAWFAANPYSQK
jgi:hypothetical protein